MRPILAFVVATTILGGLAFYMSVRRSGAAGAPVRIIEIAPGRFDVELTLTFDAGPDPFALDAGDPPSLVVMLVGKEILRETATVKSGHPRVVEDVPGVATGTNEFFVRATPADGSAPAVRAIRVRILRDGHPISAQSLWSEPGQPVEGVVRVKVEATLDEHDHERS
jgi:hypothetical protein